MKKSTIFTLIVIFLLIPLTVIFFRKHYLLTATLVIIEAMLPIFIRFEAGRVQARQLVLIALMAALAAVSRMAFAFLPHFKPITGVIMISGFALGPQAGFLTGAMAAFASNFAFGQGLWTPWQMLAFGIAGFLAGVFRFLQKKSATWGAAAFGFIAVLLFVGPLLDCSSLFLFGRTPTLSQVVTVFSVGFVPNLFHAVSCAVTLCLLTKPLGAKLSRLQRKYGI